MRQCARQGCNQRAVATMTCDYGDSTAVLGPLALEAEPQAYDLCAVHARSLTVPRGWQMVRLQMDLEAAPQSADDLEAIADAVRQAHRSGQPRSLVNQNTPPAPVTHPLPGPAAEPDPTVGVRRGHLRVIPGTETP